MGTKEVWQGPCPQGRYKFVGEKDQQFLVFGAATGYMSSPLDLCFRPVQDALRLISPGKLCACFKSAFHPESSKPSRLLVFAAKGDPCGDSSCEGAQYAFGACE